MNQPESAGGSDGDARRGATQNLWLLRAIFEAAPECVKLLGPDGVLREMNPAGLKMIEADSLAQALNQSVYPLIAREYRAQYEELIALIFRGESGKLEFEFTGLKGTRRWLETHASPLRDESGKVTALLGITRDITERKQAEESLRASETQYRTLVERMGEGLLVVNNGDVIQFANPRIAELLGYTVPEMLGLVVPTGGS